MIADNVTELMTDPARLNGIKLNASA